MKSIDEVARHIKSTLNEKSHKKIQADYINEPGIFQITYENKLPITKSESFIPGDIEGNEIFWVEREGFYYKAIHTADDPRLMMETYMPFETNFDSYKPDMIGDLRDKFHRNYSEEMLQAIKSKEIESRAIQLESSLFTEVETSEALEYIFNAFSEKGSKNWRNDFN